MAFTVWKCIEVKSLLTPTQSVTLMEICLVSCAYTHNLLTTSKCSAKQRCHTGHYKMCFRESFAEFLCEKQQMRTQRWLPGSGHRPRVRQNSLSSRCFEASESPGMFSPDVHCCCAAAVYCLVFTKSPFYWVSVPTYWQSGLSFVRLVSFQQFSVAVIGHKRIPRKL